MVSDQSAELQEAIQEQHAKDFFEWIKQAKGIVSANYNFLDPYDKAKLEIQIASALSKQYQLAQTWSNINDLKLSDWGKSS